MVSADCGSMSGTGMPASRCLSSRTTRTTDGGAVFYFVTDGFDAALARAKAVAGEGDIDIAGGAATVRQGI